MFLILKLRSSAFFDSFPQPRLLQSDPTGEASKRSERAALEDVLKKAFSDHGDDSDLVELLEVLQLTGWSRLRGKGSSCMV